MGPVRPYVWGRASAWRVRAPAVDHNQSATIMVSGRSGRALLAPRGLNGDQRRAVGGRTGAARGRRSMTGTVSQTRPTAAGVMPINGAVRARRVVLKLSGEVFGGGAIGVDPDVVQSLARQIATVVRSGMQVAVVVGGGNFFRGAELQERGMDRPRADYMGMLGTVMNCLALQDFLEKEGIDTRVQTAISMAQVAEPYIPRRAIRHLEKG